MSDKNNNQSEQALFAQADQLRIDGDPWAAIQLCQHYLSTHESSAAILDIQGRCMAASGNINEAAKSLTRAIENDPENAAYHAHMGDLFVQSGRAKESMACFQHALKLDGDSVEVLNSYAIALWAMGDLKQAHEIFERALVLQPDDVFASRNLRLVSGRMVDRWHFPMVNDEPRNRIFEQALKQVINKDSVVLDIGAGTGLLSLMAARAGARQVIACEANPALAELAREVVKANGYADRIHILNKLSHQIDPDVDFPAGEKPNVLVAEIFDTVVIGEGALQTFDHARRHLLSEDAIIIPLAADLCAGLIQSERLWREGAAGSASSFDLSSLNRFRPDTVVLEAASFEGELLSDDFVIFPFDFSGKKTSVLTQTEMDIPVTRDGVCHGIVYWIKLHMDGELTLDNRPDFGDRNADVYCEHWYQEVKLLVPPVAVKQGMKLRINARHNRQTVAVVVKDPVSGKLLS